MDTVAFVVGTLGTVLWAAGKARGWEGVLWLISSLFWIAHAAQTSQHPLMARDLLGLALYSAACWRVFIRPRLSRSKMKAEALVEVLLEPGTVDKVEADRQSETSKV